MRTRLGRIGLMLVSGAMVWTGLLGTNAGAATEADDTPSPTVAASAEPTPTPTPAEEPSEAPSPAEPAPDEHRPDEHGQGSGAVAHNDGDGHVARRARQTASVDAVDDDFSPSQVTVDQGAEVTWTNTGQHPHTVTADGGSFGSGTLDNGDSFSTTFDQAGTFPYHCEFHGAAGGVGMSGVVVVRAAGSGGGGSTSTGGTEDLPPTGRSLASVVAAGLTLAFAGIAMLLAGRRLARRPDAA